MRSTLLGLSVFLLASAAPLAAQTAHRTMGEADLAITYNAQRRDLNSGGFFWAQGGSAELSADVSHGFGASLFVSGGHANNLGGSSVNLTTVTVTAGPRYIWRRRKLALFAEGTLGESNALNTIFPEVGGAITSANSFAAQAGGGADVLLSRHIAVRVLQASWLRTQFPNVTTNVQNTLQLGAGLVFRLP